MSKYSLRSVLDWLRAGYPDGVPGPDRVPLLALLRSTPLTEDEIKEVVHTIAEVSAPLKDGQVELTFTPSVPQQDLTVFVRCDAMASSTTYKMTVELSPG